MNDETIRRAVRKAVTMAAQCRTDAGAFGGVSIVDLTPEGCCIFARSVALREGQALRITPESFQPLAGTVRWVQQGYAGIQFDTPLYGPVAEHLQQTFAALGDERPSIAGSRPRADPESAAPDVADEASPAPSYSGSCHCGAVAFTVAGAIPAQAVSCNCSHCRRKGLLLTFVPASDFTLDRGAEALTDYLFHRHAITHHFCKTCGAQPFAEGKTSDGSAMCAINLRCVPEADLDALALQKVDGASY